MDYERCLSGSAAVTFVRATQRAPETKRVVRLISPVEMYRDPTPTTSAPCLYLQANSPHPRVLYTVGRTTSKPLRPRSLRHLRMLSTVVTAEVATLKCPLRTKGSSTYPTLTPRHITSRKFLTTKHPIKLVKASDQLNAQIPTDGPKKHKTKQKIPVAIGSKKKGIDNLYDEFSRMALRKLSGA